MKDIIEKKISLDMKKILLLAVSLIAFFNLNAQDNAVFGQYNVHPILINPGATGFSEKTEIMLNLRSQWVAFPGSPKTYGINFHTPLGRTMGLGANVLSETIASTRALRFRLNYAFRYKLGNAKLGMGFSTDFQSMRLAQSVTKNSLVETSDLTVSDALEGVKTFDATLGFYGLINERTHIGLSFPNLIVARLGEIAGGQPEGSFFKYFIFDLGHKISFEQTGVSLEPSVMIRKTLNAPFRIDFNAVAGFLSDQLYAGLSYRSGTGGALGLLLGGRFSSVKVFYSYDLSFAKFQQYNNGTHEVSVAFQFSKWDKDEYQKSKKYK